MTDLGTLPRGGESHATAINDSGQITGWSDTLPPNSSYPRPDHAFIYSGGVMTDLGNITSNFDKFSKGYEKYGFIIRENGDITYREWAPNATQAYLIGDFSASHHHAINRQAGTDPWSP